MAKPTLYQVQVNSPATFINADISASQTSITVDDASKLPAAPNQVTLGVTEDAETVICTGISGNTLTVQRGFEGVAKIWVADTPIARNFSAYDYNSLVAWINDHDLNLVPKTRTINNKPLSGDITLVASDVTGLDVAVKEYAPRVIQNVTLLLANWTASGDLFTQSVSIAEATTSDVAIQFAPTDATIANRKGDLTMVCKAGSVVFTTNKEFAGEFIGDVTVQKVGKVVTL